MSAVELLEKYSDIVLRRADLDTKKQAIVDTVLTPEIKQQLADIDAEFAPAFQALSEEFAQVEAELKTAVIEAGQTVRGTMHTAVFGKPRISWDTRMLDGMATVFPQLNEARSYGAASVSIRLIK